MAFPRLKAVRFEWECYGYSGILSDGDTNSDTDSVASPVILHESYALPRPTALRGGMFADPASTPKHYRVKLIANMPLRVDLLEHHHKHSFGGDHVYFTYDRKHPDHICLHAQSRERPLTPDAILLAMQQLDRFMLAKLDLYGIVHDRNVAFLTGGGGRTYRYLEFDLDSKSQRSNLDFLGAPEEVNADEEMGLGEGVPVSADCEFRRI